MLTNSDIKDAFFWLLGREPESQKVSESFLKLEDRISLRDAILQSQEFQARQKKINECVFRQSSPVVVGGAQRDGAWWYAGSMP